MCWLLGFLCYLSLQQPCQELVDIAPGAPIVRNYAPSDYRGSQQNWGITQDARGLMYFGNNQGVLIFDGHNWESVQLANRSIARGLAAASDGRVYVGGTNEFGYIDADDRGRAVYRSLSERLAPEARQLSNISSVLATSHGVYFRGKGALYRYHEDRLTRIEAEGRGEPILIEDRLVYYLPERGIAVIDANGLRVLPHTLPLTEKYEWLILCPGQGNELIMIGADGRFIKTEVPSARERGRAPAPELDQKDVPVTDYLAQNQIYYASRLANGNLALATLHGGTVITDPPGHPLQFLREDEGLRRNRVHRLFQDRQNNLWLTLNSGIAMVEAAPFTRFTRVNGLEESLITMGAFKGQVYCGTYAGLFRLNGDRFDLIERADHGFWDLVEVGDHLLALGDRLVVVEGKRTRPLEVALNGVYYCLGVTPRFPNHLFLGSRSGLSVLSLEDVDGQLRAGTLRRLGEVQHRVRNISADPAGHLWLGSSYRGISFLRFGDVPEQVQCFSFSTEHGLPHKNGNRPYWMAGGLLVDTAQGPFGLVGEGPESWRFQPHPLLSLADGLRTRSFESHPNGQIWALTDEGMGYYQPQAGGGYQWHPSPVRELGGRGIFVANDAVWVETTEGVRRFDAPECLTVRQPFATRLSKVVLDDHDLLFGGHGQPEPLFRLPRHNARGSIAFEYAATWFNQAQANQFQYRLEGYDAQWSAWSERQRAVYTNLPGGEYHFQVRARNIYNQVGSPAAYRFSIPKPWYLRASSLTVFTVALLVALILALKSYGRYLEARHQRMRDKERVLQEAQKFEALGRLAGGIAHDFNGILASIYGFSSLLQAELGSNPTAALSLREIENAGERGQDLVNQILTFARRDKPKLKALDCYEQVSRALVLARVSLPPGVRLTENLDRGAGWLMGNATQLHQVVVNLFQNALQALPEENGEVEVGLEGVVCDGKPLVRLWVRDNGMGMDAPTRAHIFEPFFTTRGEQGTGLGLAVVHGIVEGMGGTVSVTSSTGEGSLFELFFAAVPPPDPDTSELAGLPKGQGERILWIDDDPARLQRAVLLLRKLGYHAIGAGHNESPLNELARANRCPWVVFIGTGEPASCYKMLTQIRATAADLPVLLCCPRGQAEQEQAMGFDGFLPSPPGAVRMSDLLERMLGSRRRRSG